MKADGNWSLQAGRIEVKTEEEGLFYHYCMALEDVSFGVLVPDPERTDPDDREATAWLAREIGFWPVFVAVGDSLDAYLNTGYHMNWARVVQWSSSGTVLRKAGEHPNLVLLSFAHLEGVFMDHDYWFLVLNARDIERDIGLVQRRWIFKPSWSRRKWLRSAMGEERMAMLVCPQLELRSARRVWVRNRRTKRALEGLGFPNVVVHRIPVPRL